MKRKTFKSSIILLGVKGNHDLLMKTFHQLYLVWRRDQKSSKPADVYEKSKESQRSSVMFGTRSILPYPMGVKF